MPTSRPRYTVTETDALRAALDDIAREHPELADDRNALFRRLVESATERRDLRRQREARRAALARMSARGLNYPPGYRDELRREWPA
ncbi:MAG: hypothetical protein WBL06_01755 [Pseudolysinimonas sp.]|uniref:hypothetical protein n=1 Tax=Pseudolysinimonas sp. TaxID=2680009 RepID=UPI003C782888